MIEAREPARVTATILFTMAFTLSALKASAAPWPSLHPRPAIAAADRAVAPWKRGAPDFPQDAAGFYRYRDPVEGVQIVAHDGGISGYLLKLGKGGTDKGQVLGYKFSDVAGDRRQLWFTTRQVHGIWYGFDGRVVPRHSLGQSAKGRYLLEGTLTMHDEAQQTTARESVKLRSEANSGGSSQ